MAPSLLQRLAAPFRPDPPARLSLTPRAEAKSVPILTYPAQLFFGIADREVADAPIGGTAAYAAAVLAYICMRYRATKLTEAPVWIVDETEDGEEWLRGTHPLEGLLEQPNPDMEAGEFWELVSLYLDAPGGGACLLVKNRDRAGRVAQLYPYAKAEFVVEPADGRLFGRFRVQALGGSVRIYQPEDVIYLRETDPRSPWGALSAGDAALADLNLGEQQRRAVQAVFRNMVRPGGFVETDAPLGDDIFNRLKAEFTASYSGVQNAGKVMLLDHGSKYKALDNSLKELDLGPIMLHVESTVCATFGINPVLLGLRAAAGLNGGLADSIRPAQDLYYDLVQLPRWERIGRKLTQGLLREVEPDNLRRFIRFDTTRVRALQEDVAEKVTTAAAAAGFWTRAEQRAHTGMDPDVPPDAPAVVPGGTDDDDGKRAAGTVETKAVSDRDVAWLLFDAIATAQESSVRLVAASQLQQDRDAIVAIVQAAERKEARRPLTEAELAAIEKDIATYQARAQSRWQDAVRPPLRLIAQSAVERVASSVGIGFDVLQQGLLEVVEREAAWSVGKITETTREGVRAALRAGIEAGESISDIAQRITQAGEFADSRATLIARTETTRVTNLTQREQLEAYAKRTGKKVRKTWLNAGDERVRDEHLNAPAGVGGEVRDIDEPFSNGLQAPGQPACRCTLTYQISEEAAA